jgi:hypothetical protein
MDFYLLTNGTIKMDFCGLLFSLKMNHLIMHLPRIPSNKYVKLQAKCFLVISNNLMVTICFDYQLTPTKKLITKANTSWVPFGIQRLIVNFTKVDRTYN